VTLAELAPWAALGAALGVALLLTRSSLGERAAGTGLVGVGAVVVALHAEPRLADVVTGRPLLVAVVALVGVAVLLGLGTLVSSRLWLVPIAALAVAWLRLPVGGDADAPKLLLPLSAVIAVAP